MRPSAARIAVPCAVLVAAVALAGCGSAGNDQPQMTISFQAPSSGPLAARAADIRRAAQLEIDAIGGDAVGHRIALVNGPDLGSVAAIDALAAVTRQGTDQLLVTLRPPVKRVVDAPGGSRPSQAPKISLLPPVALAQAARSSYAASGASGASSAVVDSPLDPGTPTGRYVTAALSEDALPPAGAAFYEKFRKEYGRDPDRWAIYGYEAVGLIVDAMTRADKAGLPVDQKNVAEQALAIRDRFSPVGHYDVLASGQTTLYVFQARGAGAPGGPSSLIEALR